MDVVSQAMMKNTQMLQSAVQTSMLRKTMNQDAQAMAGVLEMAPPPPQSGTGALMDIKA